MIPTYQLIDLALAEQRQRDTERRRRHDHGEPGVNAADFTRRPAGSRLDALRRALARLAAPAQRPTMA